MARGLAQRQAIACGTVEGLGWCFLHSSHSKIWAGSLKLLLAIGAYARINVKEKVHMRLFLKSSEVPCPRPQPRWLPSRRNAASGSQSSVEPRSSRLALARARVLAFSRSQLLPTSALGARYGLSPTHWRCY